MLIIFSFNVLFHSVTLHSARFPRFLLPLILLIFFFKFGNPIFNF